MSICFFVILLLGFSLVVATVLYLRSRYSGSSKNLKWARLRRPVAGIILVALLVAVFMSFCDDIVCIIKCLLLRGWFGAGFFLVVLSGFALVVAREWWLEGSYPDFNKSWRWPRWRRILLGAIMVLLLALGVNFIPEVSEHLTSDSAGDSGVEWELPAILAGIVIAVLTGIYFVALQNTLNNGKEVLRQLSDYESRFIRAAMAFRREKDNHNNIDFSVAALLYEAIQLLNIKFPVSHSKSAGDEEIHRVLTELHWLDKFRNLADSIREGDSGKANVDANSLVREIENRRRDDPGFKKSLFRNSLYTVWPVLQEYWYKVGGAESLKQYEGLTQLYYILSQEFGQQDLLEDFD